ncbi:ATP phosphoribosyltransferase regulatory subunit [Anaeroselena agilis]|uniref:ATP phosphoribosyltransferase regulatory subunit n=1 Tax=Anaeroselena agilis TaxID=3063788 RepID=A0ABU3NTP6_9FIRM|nr:ATP phosphoribosyltransferase regulatory subunit [Selenomonadales bacterium 4137-cl]
MSRSQFLPQIPYGTKDFLPRDARRKRAAENALASLFARWGYDEVVTPTFEYLETLTVGVSGDLVQSLFKFFDRNNAILALRPDMTTPIARVAATRFRESVPPLRLFYLTNVFRQEQAQAGRQCEFYQAGVELLGAGGPAADAEVVALAVTALLETGLTNFQVGLGQVQFLNGVMAESGLTAGEQQRVKQFLVSRDLVGLGEILAGSSLSAAAQKLIREIPLLHGNDKVVSEAYRLVGNDVSRAALDNLADIRRLLAGYGVERYVTFDLGLIRDLDYYTGMVFEGYTPGLGFPLCGGGRYDNMVAAFGVDCPATGFAMGIERILLALERQGIAPPEAVRDAYVAWDEGALAAAIAEAGRLRHEGRTVEMALEASSRAEAEAARAAKGYSRLVYCDNNVAAG